MLGKIERKILAGILAASMCLTYLPVGMGQVRAEEGIAETEVMADQMDQVPELKSELLDEEGDAIEVGLPEEAETLDSENVSEMPEEIQSSVENERADEVEELPEEAVRNYDAADGTPLEIGVSYAIEETLGKIFTFTPEADGRYLAEKNFGDDDEWISFSIFQGDERAEQIQGRVHKVKQGKPYTLEVTSRKDGVTGTWKIVSLQPKAVVEGEKYTYSYEEYAYYTFVPEESGTYQMKMYDTDEFIAVIEKSGTNQCEYLSSNISEVDLVAGSRYEIYFFDSYGEKPVNTVSWKLDQIKDVTVTEGTSYEETAEFLHRYTFECEEEGEYMLDLKYTRNGNILLSNFESQDEKRTIVQPKFVMDTLDSYQYYVKLKGNTKYSISFYSWDEGNPEITCTWRIRKVSEKELALGVSDTFSTEDVPCYTFAPTESGLYQLTFDKDVQTRVYAENAGRLYNSKYSDWESNYYVYSFQAGETYSIYMSKPYVYTQEDDHAVEDCKIQMTKMSAKTIDADQICQRQENEPVYYRLKAKTAGRYMITGALILNNDLSSFDYGKLTFVDQFSAKVIASLEQGEEIILLFGGEKQSICIGSVKSADGFEFALRPDGTAAILSYTGEMKDLVIPDKLDGAQVTVIEKSAFSESDIESVVLPSTLKEIGEFAFSGTNLKEIVIPDSVTSVGGAAFSECALLKKAVIGSGVEAINSSLFRSCVSLEEVVLPKNGSLTAIQYYAFQGCNCLSKITFPDTIEKCSNGAFGESEENYALWYRKLQDGEIYIGKVLYEYKGTVPEGTKVTVRPGTVSVNAKAFWMQTGVSEVTLPYGLKEIGYYALSGTNLKEIVIPSSVTKIESYAVGYEGVYKETAWGGYYEPVKLDDFVIYGQKGSAAEKYAIENKFEFVEKMTYAKGDVDLSGKVDISDLRLMLRAVCGKFTLTGDQIAAGDIAGQSSADVPDGEISIADLRKLLRFICGKIEAL